MLGEGGTPLSEFESAARCFMQRGERGVDLKRYRAVLDALEGDFAVEARHVQQTGAHLVDGNATVVTWISRLCGMSATSAADRLCVGAELEALPKVAKALSSGDIGYQSASLLCRLRDQLGDKRELFDEDEMLELARRHSVAGLRYLCRYARHCADPDGFFNDAEADYSRRELHISQMPDGMHAIDGVLDPAGGAALRTALESLAKRLGPDDDRSHKQRMADSLAELAHHAMDEGRLPKRNGVRPPITVQAGQPRVVDDDDLFAAGGVTTTLEGLKNEVGAPAADMELSLPISTRTLERLACDCTISRVLLADSMVIDVGRGTRVVSAPTRRALRVRDRGCRWPGCDRQVNWSTPHHIIAWAHRGPGNLPNLVLLCFYHHRLVHEGGWQVVKVGREFRFVPPDRVVMRRARGPGVRWAA